MWDPSRIGLWPYKKRMISLPAAWGNNQKVAMCKPRRKPSPELNSAGTLISNIHPPVSEKTTFCCLNHPIYRIFEIFYLLILERERRERRKHWFTASNFYAFISWFLYVPWTWIEPTTMAYQDKALTQWSPTILTPGTGFMEDNFSTDPWWGAGMAL